MFLRLDDMVPPLRYMIEEANGEGGGGDDGAADDEAP